MTNERITIQWRGNPSRISLLQMQQVISGISGDYTNSELSAMLDMFVGVTEAEDSKGQAERAEEMIAVNESKLTQGDD